MAGNGITGLWIGYFLGILVQMIIVGCMTITADWQEIADKAEARMLNANEESVVATSPAKNKANDYESLFSEIEIDEEKQTLLHHSTDDELCTFENGQIDDVIKGKRGGSSSAWTYAQTCQSVGLGLETMNSSCL